MTTVQGATRWTVQHTLSCASFDVRNFGVRTVHGRIPIMHAHADVDGDGNPVDVHAELDLAAIDTANDRRDADLAKPKLLDLAKFPSLTFHSDSGEAAGDGWRIPGRLTAHGTSIDVVLHVVRDGDRITATTSFDRADLGIRAPRLLIGRRIDVRIEAVLAPEPA